MKARPSFAAAAPQLSLGQTEPAASPVPAEVEAPTSGRAETSAPHAGAQRDGEQSEGAPAADVLDVLGLPARLLARLPAPSTLWCRTEGRPGYVSNGGFVVLTTSRVAYIAAGELGWPAFVGSEIGWLALAAELDRAAPATMARWLARKGEERSWRLSRGVALGGMEDAGEGLVGGWPLGQVLVAWGLRLIDVGVGDDLPWIDRKAQGLERGMEARAS